MNGAGSLVGSVSVLPFYAAAAVAALFAAYDVPSTATQATQLRWRTWLLILLAGLPPLVLITVSFVRPIFVPRYLVEIVPILAILAARGLSLIRRPALVVGAACLFLIVSIRPEIAFFRAPYNQGGQNLYYRNLQAAASTVAVHSRPGDAIGYMQPFARVAFSYFLTRAESSTRHQLADIARAPHGSGEEVGDLLAQGVSPELIDRRLSPYGRIWLIGYPASIGYLSPEPFVAAPTQLTQHLLLAQTLYFGAVQVLLYVRSP